AVAFFVIMSFLSGIVVSRWMTWFSSGENADKRGYILGWTICITYILLSIGNYTMAHLNNGSAAAILLPAGGFLVGGWFCTYLPLPTRKMRSIPIRQIFPPADLLLLGLLAYGVVSLFYNSIFISQTIYPILPWLLIIPYLAVSLILARLSDRFDRYFLAFTGFFFCGAGFLIYVARLNGFTAVLIFNIMISAGLLCIHFFYWLSLVDRQNSKYQPFRFITGVLFELIVVGIGITMVERLQAIPELRLELIGLSGILLVLLGVAVSFSYIYSFYHKLKRQPGPADPVSANRQNRLDNNLSALAMLSTVDGEALSLALGKHFNLTKREKELALLLFSGYSSSQIIETLFISPNTLKFHMKNILAKLGAANRLEAAAVVLEKISELKEETG
ncbi:MAG: helix-turn-helix transcriptional regulator, partial [Dethiobacteria bacterium]|nr:helix-turn-helix transcriptional regulator [Dethiobacteria bacterium]